MLLSRRTQLQLSTLCVLIAIGLYCFDYIVWRPHNALKHGRGRHGHVHSAGDADEHRPENLTRILHPTEHLYRAPRKISLKFNVTLGYRSPDGVKRRLFLINGVFPGPTIEARSGDEFEVEVYNGLQEDEGIAIHWHGLSMRGSNEMDGPVGVTQCAIGKSETFTYKFKIQDNEAGTFWYHAHSEVHRADGLYGALIVHRPAESDSGMTEMRKFRYDEELVLLIGDWYHRPAREVLAYYTNWVNYGNEPAPDSLLINGVGAFNCSMAVPARPVDCKKVTPLPLAIKARRSRLRVLNTGALTGFTLSIPGQRMSIVQVDGGSDTHPSPAADSIGILYPGERIDVVLEPVGEIDKKQPRITVALDPENMVFPNFALTRTQHFPLTITGKRRKRSKPNSSRRQLATNRHFDLVNVSGLIHPSEPLPSVASKTFLLYTNIEILSEFNNIPKGFMNRSSWTRRDPKAAPLLALSREHWRDDPFVPVVPSGPDEWVDIVINNMDDKGHPFHLHGYDFYVLATHKARVGAFDAYNPFDATKAPVGGPLNTRDPPRKDTVFVPRRGYVVLRFRADNEGLWLFHCHVLWHEAVGMGMAFQVGPHVLDAEDSGGKKTKASELCRRV